MLKFALERLRQCSHADEIEILMFEMRFCGLKRVFVEESRFWILNFEDWNEILWIKNIFLWRKADFEFWILRFEDWNEILWTKNAKLRSLR